MQSKESSGSRILYFVTGSTSACNHLVSRILILMGCAGDYAANAQGVQLKFDGWYSDGMELPKHDGPATWRREIPYLGHYPDFLDIKERLEEVDYEVKTIYVIRNWNPMFKSAYYRHPERRAFEQVFDLAITENVHILESISFLKPLFIFNTSILFKYPQASVDRLERFTGLSFPLEGFNQIYLDTDSKWKNPVVLQNGST